MKDLGGSVVLRRIGLVVGLFLFFGSGLVSAAGSAYDFMNFGFSALAAYGVLLLVNKELVSLNISRFMQAKTKFEQALIYGGTLLTFVGVSVLASILLPPIINQNVVVIYGDALWVEAGVQLALISPILIPQVLFVMLSAKKLGISKLPTFLLRLGFYLLSVSFLMFHPGTAVLLLVLTGFLLLIIPLRIL